MPAQTLSRDRVLSLLPGAVLCLTRPRLRAISTRSKVNDAKDEEDGQLGASAAARALPCEFCAITPALSFRVCVFFNGVLLGLLPAIVFILIPLPEGYREQGIFYKDAPFLLFTSALSLGMSALVVALRVPLRYRITRTRLEIVSWARGKWWWSPCYYMCTPGYSIPLTDLKSAQTQEGKCLLPPFLIPPPRTVLGSGSEDSLLCIYRTRALGRCFKSNGLISWVQPIYLSPEEPLRMSKLLNSLAQDVGRGVLLPREAVQAKPLHRKKNDQLGNGGGRGGGGRGGGSSDPPSGVRAAPPTFTSGGPASNGIGSMITYPQLMMGNGVFTHIQRAHTYMYNLHIYNVPTADGRQRGHDV